MVMFIDNPFFMKDYRYFVKNVTEDDILAKEHEENIRDKSFRHKIRRKLHIVKRDLSPHKTLLEVNRVFSAFHLDDKDQVTPHVHLVGEHFHTVLRLDKPEYLDHGYPNDIMTKSQTFGFINWIGSVFYPNTETYWESLMMCYNYNGVNASITKMPNYALLLNQWRDLK